MDVPVVKRRTKRREVPERNEQKSSTTKITVPHVLAL
jgi:hypothetical protein